MFLQQAKPITVKKKLDAEILDLSKQRTAMGRLVTARVTAGGKVMIAGPSDTFWLKKTAQFYGSVWCANHFG